MLKNISRLEIKVGEKDYHFNCDHDSPLQDVKAALEEFLKYVVTLEEGVRASQEALEKAKEMSGEPTEVV